MYSSAHVDPASLFSPRTTSRLALLAGYILAMFGGCLLVVAGTATGPAPAARELLAAAGIAELIVATGLATGARWAPVAAIAVVVAGLDAIAGAVLALAVGIDPFGAMGGARASAGNTIAVLFFVALGYWIVFVGARRALRPA